NDQRSDKRPRRAAALLALICLLLVVGLTTMGFLCKLLYFLHKRLVVYFANDYLFILMSAMAANGVMFHRECVTDTKHSSEKQLKTWDQSRSDCRQKGADLLIINSEEEQVSQFTRYMWIGLTDVTNEGSWKWVDGTAMSTRLLSLIRGLTLVEPNGGGKDENCVDIKNFNAEKSWNDESCSLSLFN
uniref:C-type lectin domain-containing protein n=1 Tax=Takifugu rubripes TaxID=31033 RepID=A0A674NTI1_TAKRU